jgi:peptidoglycan/LPS O-acetylase OafA/YrhL
MMSIASHLALGLLLGGLCGVGMSSQRRPAQQLLRALSLTAAVVFMCTAMAAKLISAPALAVERLADVVMSGVAMSLIVSALALSLKREQRAARAPLRS